MQRLKACEYKHTEIANTTKFTTLQDIDVVRDFKNVTAALSTLYFDEGAPNRTLDQIE